MRSVPPTVRGREKLVELDLIDPAVAKGVDVALENIGLLEGRISTNVELEKITKDEIEKIGFGQTTPEEAADTMIEAYTKKLEELKKQ